MEWPRFGFHLYMCICGVVDAQFWHRAREMDRGLGEWRLSLCLTSGESLVVFMVMWQTGRMTLAAGTLPIHLALLCRSRATS